ncbi:MAG: dihydrolipoyl dehydrogenase, partial [Candidatus Fonsibacter ubiquis]|nr:dihydrolipoyl dehydrogenase [Candidatus Fonsibacter ubiquis]
EKIVVSSTGALNLNSVPKKLVVIGAGYIGLEMGSVWLRLGSEVQVVEYLDYITPGMDREVSDAFLKILQKQGMQFNLSTKVIGVTKNKKGATVSVEKNGTKSDIDCDVVLMSVGRKPNTTGLNLDKIGVKLDSKGRVETNHQYKTNLDNIYAIGDVIAGPMLAHKAEEEGIAVAEFLSGKYGHVNYDVIPGVIYTAPEVASVGKTEEQLKEQKISYKVGKFPFAANARAKVNDEGDGFVKILSDEKTDRVLGVHMIGPDVGNMIGEMCLAMEFGASSEDIARTCHAHPTLAEAIKEAALAVDKRAIHF